MIRVIQCIYTLIAVNIMGQLSHITCYTIYQMSVHKQHTRQVTSNAKVNNIKDDVWFSFVNCIFTNNVFNQVLISLSNTNAELSSCSFLKNSNSQVLKSQFIGKKAGDIVI